MATGIEVNCSTGEVTEVEFELPPANPTDNIKAQISVLEAMQTPRRIRESVLGIDNGWLANIESQITDLRTQLK